jgi:hypothetical protein
MAQCEDLTLRVLLLKLFQFGGKNMVLYVIIAFLVLIIFVAIRKEVKSAEKNMNENHFAVRQSKTVLWIGIICTVFFCALIVLMIMFPNDTAEWWVFLVFSLAAVWGLCIILYCVAWELRVEDNQITYSPFIGKKKSFPIDFITKIKFNGQQIKAYAANKKLFTVDSSCRGYNILVFRLKNEQIPFGG